MLTVQRLECSPISAVVVGLGVGEDGACCLVAVAGVLGSLLCRGYCDRKSHGWTLPDAASSSK